MIMLSSLHRSTLAPVSVERNPNRTARATEDRTMSRSTVGQWIWAWSPCRLKMTTLAVLCLDCLMMTDSVTGTY
eukprot:7594424-Pyramimonas_sp.AAC.1